MLTFQIEHRAGQNVPSISTVTAQVGLMIEYNAIISWKSEPFFFRSACKKRGSCGELRRRRKKRYGAPVGEVCPMNRSTRRCLRLGGWRRSKSCSRAKVCTASFGKGRSEEGLVGRYQEDEVEVMIEIRVHFFRNMSNNQ